MRQLYLLHELVRHAADVEARRRVARPDFGQLVVRVEEIPVGPQRVARQDRHRVVARHRARARVEDLGRDARRLVRQQEHEPVIAVHALQRFGLISASGW